MNTLINVDYTSYSDDELEQAIKDIQKVKANRKESRSNKQKIFIKSLSNQENESLSKDQNMLKTYIIGYIVANNNDRTHNGYVIQNNSNDKCSFGYDFSNFVTMNNYDKKNTGEVSWTGAVFYTIDSFISFSYNEI